jgi:hypothetical protein
VTDRDADDVVAYYGLGLERDRLGSGQGALELARTQAILERHLPPAPALYHLPERSDHLRALAEARRICRPGGMIIAARPWRRSRPRRR